MKIIAFVAVLAVAVAAAQASTLDAIIAREGPASGSFSAFQGFMSEFDRVYETPSEMSRRFAIFQANMEEAAAFNVAEPLAEYGVTRFSDMTKEEFAAGFLTVFPDASSMSFPASAQAKPAPATTLSPVPNSVDWRGQLNPIKDQKSCGSCWAFSVNGAVEGSLVASGKPLVDASEQSLVDCDPLSGGCNGGWMHWGLNTVNDIGVISQESYPYEAQTKSCRKDDADVIESIDGVHIRCANSPYVEPEIQSDDCTDDDTRAAVSAAPQSIAINANHMMSYRGGIADPSESTCGHDQLNHGVVIVGYDEADGVQYYIIRNSWGTRWGDKGHYMIAANKNACGIQRYQVEAVVSH